MSEKAPVLKPGLAQQITIEAWRKANARAVAAVARAEAAEQVIERVRELTDPDACPIPETDEDARGTAGWRFAMEHVRAALDGAP